MSPQHGGLSDKIGNRFEDRWTVHCCLMVLRGKADTIRLEPPGPEGEGVEFWLKVGDAVEYHQVKRQLTGRGHWTLNSLAAEGVLETFYAHLTNPATRCCFVSTHAADALDELADRARQATSWQEFDAFLLQSNTWRAAFETLVKAWRAAEPETAYRALGRIAVKTIGEDELDSLNQFAAELALAGAPSDAVPVLTQLLRDHAGQLLTSTQLWAELADRGWGPKPWTSPDVLATSVREANRRFVASRERTLIGRALIERQEAVVLGEYIHEHRVVVVEGAAGMGKSDVLLQLIRDLDSDGIPHLALRLDAVTPTLNPSGLGQELGLPGSPAVALAALAVNGPSVLILDQLDIVSTTSGRSTQLFECVHEIIDLALSSPSTSIVLACRAFDLENDPRLRRLVPQIDPRPVVTVGPLPEAQVLSTLESLGFAAQLTTAQQSVLSVPLHLALLSEAADPAAPLTFQTAADLYDAFWNNKRVDVRGRLGRDPAWTEVLDVVADYMSTRQVLRAPTALLDPWQSDGEAMTSSHVLVNDGTHVTFFHETFFDYVFARRFSARDNSIAVLLAGDQHLFRRAQVRQILAYNRDRDERYAEDLRYLIEDTSVRFHIKDAVVSWLVQVDPGDVEWSVVAPLLTDSANALHTRALKLLDSSRWFAHADARGYVTSCLLEPERANSVMSALQSAANHSPQRVAELLSTRALDGSDWTTRIVWVLRGADLGSSRDLFDLLAGMLLNGAFEPAGATRQDFWLLASDLPDTAPVWALELVGLYLENRIEAARALELPHPFGRDANLIPPHLHLHEFLTVAAEAAPPAFLEHVWPPMKVVIEAAMRPMRDGRLRSDEIWPMFHFGDGARDLDDGLFAAAEIAFGELAVHYPDQFRTLFRSHAATEAETIAYLLLKGCSANPDELADLAINQFIADPRWLRVGHSDSDEWGSRRALQALTPSASENMIQRLEPVVLGVYTPWEKSAAGHRQFGLTQFALLGGIADDRRTPAMNKRLAEWQRKFERDEAPGPYGIRSGVVGPPIPADAASRMSDRQWKRAIQRYATDDFADRSHFLRGGAHEMANVLEAETKRDPWRFISLACDLPDSTNVAYFDAILRGVAASEETVAPSDIEQLVLRCHALPGRPCGRWIVRPLQHSAEAPLSPAMVKVIAWYGVESPDPFANAVTIDDDDPDMRLLQTGLNSVRGGVAHEVARFIWACPANLSSLRAVITALVNDDSTAVRAMASEIVLALLRTDAALALDLFDQLVSSPRDELLAVRHVHQFLLHRVHVDFDRLRPVLKRMLWSDIPEVQERGAVLATVARLDCPAADDLAEAALSGAETQRRGAARVYAANLATAADRDQCEKALVRLLNDPARSVRDAAASVTRELEDDQLDEYGSLLESLRASAAGKENVGDLLHALSEMAGTLPASALDTCEFVLGTSWTTDDEIDVPFAVHLDLVSQVLVRYYAQSRGAARERSLDLIDQCLARGVHGVQSALADHDRAWLGGDFGPRPPRRRRRRRKST